MHVHAIYTCRKEKRCMFTPQAHIKEKRDACTRHPHRLKEEMHVHVVYTYKKKKRCMYTLPVHMKEKRDARTSNLHI